MKYHIVGIHKCGTTSLEKYLRDQGHDVVRNESLFHRIDGVNYHFVNYPDYQPVIILRDPVERVWSHFIYKKYYQPKDVNKIDCDLETALKTHPEIVLPSLYDRWLSIWKVTKPLIYNLTDELKSKMPKLNMTTKEPLTDSQRQLIRSAIDELLA